MHITHHGLISLILASLVSFLPFVAYGQKTMADNIDRLAVTSLLLTHAQCELALPGYKEKAQPHFRSWRKDNLKVISNIEAAPNFKQKIDMVLKRYPRLSERAKIGVNKDCAAILRDLAVNYGH